MNMHNINNEKILKKLRLLIVCSNDDFSGNAFNFLILEDCININYIASLCDDLASLESLEILEILEILKKLINFYIKNLIKINHFLCYKAKLTDICLNQLSKSDQELYQYKFKQLIRNKDSYLFTFKKLLK